MTIGERIKMIRVFKGFTQKELGAKTGIHEVAIRKYELNKVKPKLEQLEKIADNLCVPINSLLDIKAETDSDIIPLLFAIDECFPVTIQEVEGKPTVQFDCDSLNRFLEDWKSMKELLVIGKQTEDNYRLWKSIRPGYTKVHSIDDSV